MELSLWEDVISAGTSDEQSFRERRKIISTNLATITIIALTIPFVPYFYFLGLEQLSVLLALVMIFLGQTILLNHLGRQITAKIWFIGFCNFSCFQFAAACGKGSGIHYVLLPFCAFPFLLFELKHIKVILTLTCISISLFFLQQYEVITSSLIKIDAPTLSKIFYPITITSFLILIFIMLYLTYENEHAEQSLSTIKEKFENEINDARAIIDNSSYDNSISIADILLQQIIELQKSKEFLNKTHTRLKKTNEDLDNFIYTVSHDLKYPISNIEGLLNALILNPSYEEEEFKWAVDLISKSVARFKNTIGELTEITKIQINTSEIKEINLEELMEEILFSLKEQINQCKAKIIYDFEECQSIYFLRSNLRSILFHLVSNSLKYKSADRNPLILISTRVDANDRIELSVSDNGIGIHENHRDKIFSMFKRVHDHVDGSGVGLYIVKRIVDNNGGRIELESEVSKGSKFKIYLKLVSPGQVIN